MKKGFSLAELLMALVVVGVIASVTLPMMVNSVDTYKPMYKSAFRIAETLVNQLISDSDLYPTGNFYNTSTGFFCNSFSNAVNTIKYNTCITSAVAGTPNLLTSNGMAWYGLNATFASNVTIRVDIDGQNRGSNTNGDDILGIIISPLGKLTPAAATEINYLIQ